MSSQKLYRLNTNPISPMGKVSLEKPRDLVKVTQILDLKLGPGWLQNLDSLEPPAIQPLRAGVHPGEQRASWEMLEERSTGQRKGRSSRLWDLFRVPTKLSLEPFGSCHFCPLVWLSSPLLSVFPVTPCIREEARTMDKEWDGGSGWG